MNISEFLKLIKSGFDVSFNFHNVFYTISTIDEIQGKKVYGLGSDNGLKIDFNRLELISEFKIDNVKIKDIISSLSEEDIFY